MNGGWAARTTSGSEGAPGGAGGAFADSFDRFSEAAITGNAQAMAAMIAASGLNPASGASAAQIVNAGWESLTSAQQTEIATTVLAPAFMASSGGHGAIDGGRFAAIVGATPALSPPRGAPPAIHARTTRQDLT